METSSGEQHSLTLPSTAAVDTPGGGYTLAGIRFFSPTSSAAWLAGLEETTTPAPTTPGFGAAAAGAALLLLVAVRKRRW